MAIPPQDCEGAKETREEEYPAFLEGHFDLGLKRGMRVFTETESAKNVFVRHLKPKYEEAGWRVVARSLNAPNWTIVFALPTPEPAIVEKGEAA